MTNSEYQIYTLLVSLLSAIGTISAVIVALYLANKDRKISLKIDNNIFEFENSPNGEYIFIQILNNGYQPVYIKNILIERNIFYKKYIPINEKYIYMPQTSFTPPLHKLEVGEVVTLAIEKQFIQDIYKDILFDYSKLELFTLKFTVNISYSKTFRSKFHKNIKSLIENTNCTK